MPRKRIKYFLPQRDDLFFGEVIFQLALARLFARAGPCRLSVRQLFQLPGQQVNLLEVSPVLSFLSVSWMRRASMDWLTRWTGGVSSHSSRFFQA
jgi:hypothetical protein